MSELCYYCFREKPNTDTCPYCGYRKGMLRAKYPLALPEGSVLSGRYIVGRVLGQGGFGITYVAQDYRSKQLVAIKEFFPDTAATRTGSSTVATFSGERGELFEYGKERFADEAKAIARFINHPNIVTIYSFFEENNTAYYAMEYIQGENLQSYLNRRGGKTSFGDARRLLYPIMDALSAVHSVELVHRDISPDNIYITKDNTVKLLDFGAARYSLGNKSKSLDIILKHGYAPKEQYTRHSTQGPYTDVYALAATFYRAITGQTPPDSIERIDGDTLIPPDRFCADIPESATAALMQALSVYPKDRFQTMQAFKTAMPPMPLKKEKAKDSQPEKNDSSSSESTSTSTSSTNPFDTLPKWALWLIFAGSGTAAVVLLAAIIAALT